MTLHLSSLSNWSYSLRSQTVLRLKMSANTVKNQKKRHNILIVATKKWKLLRLNRALLITQVRIEDFSERKDGCAHMLHIYQRVKHIGIC